MLIFILHGDNETLLANANCSAINFINYMKQKCSFDKASRIELSDESGLLANITEKADMQNLILNVNEKANYIPVKIEKNEDKTFNLIEPLLQGWEKTYPGLHKKIKQLNGPEKTHKSFHESNMTTPEKTKKNRNSNRKDSLSTAEVSSKKSSHVRAGKRKTPV